MFLMYVLNVVTSKKKDFTYLLTCLHVIKTSVDADQMGPKKPADQNLHCFPFCLLIHVI